MGLPGHCTLPSPTVESSSCCITILFVNHPAALREKAAKRTILVVNVPIEVRIHGVKHFYNGLRLR